MIIVNNDVYMHRDFKKVNVHDFLIKNIIRLFTLPYKRPGKVGHGVSEVQSVLCEEAVCLKRLQSEQLSASILKCGIRQNRDLSK